MNLDNANISPNAMGSGVKMKVSAPSVTVVKEQLSHFNDVQGCLISCKKFIKYLLLNKQKHRIARSGLQ